MMQRTVRHEKEKTIPPGKLYWKAVQSLERSRVLLERFRDDRDDLEEDVGEEIAQAINEIDDLGYRLYSLRFALRESGAFSEEPREDGSEEEWPGL